MCRGIHHVATYDEAGVSKKFLTHINVEYQMTLDLLISCRDITLWFLLGLKFRANVIRVLTQPIPPQCITILLIEIDCLLCIIWDLYPELVILQPIIGFYFCNYVDSSSSKYEAPTKQSQSP